MLAGTFNIRGGSITENTAGGNGGGVCSFEGALNISGAPVISGNKRSVSSGVTVNNVYFLLNKTITVTGALTEGADIGVSMQTPGVFTKPATSPQYTVTSNDADKFHSDNEAYTLLFVDNGASSVVKLVPPHIHSVSTDCSKTDGTQAPFEKLTSSGGTLSEGNYYLDADVTLTSTLTISGTVNLCLNGHKLNANGGAFSAITVPSSAVLNLCDCNGSSSSHAITSPVTSQQVTITGGLITGSTGGGVNLSGTLNMYGGTIAGNKAKSPYGGGINITSGAFNMYGGSIRHNRAIYGGGIFNQASAAIHGGSITENHADDTGGGLFSNNAADLTALSGAVKITGNTQGADPVASNLHLYSGNTATISDSLTDGAEIGVTMATSLGAAYPVPITTANSADYSAFFTSDNESYEIRNSGTGAEQVVKLYLKPVAVTKAATTNGSFTVTVGGSEVASGGTVDPGQTVTITPSANTGFNIGTVSVVKTGDTATNVTVTNNTFVMPKYPVTVSVTFTAATYTVSYNANGGSGAPQDQTKTYGEPLTLSSTTPTRAGYAFTGWNTNAGGSGTDYAAGGEYTANAAATLYAQWSPIPATEPTINSATGASLTYGYTSGSVSVSATAATGHSITGYQWYSTDSASNTTGGTQIPNANAASYSVPTGKSAGSYYYYCVVTTTRTDNDQTATATSGVATVTVGRAAQSALSITGKPGTVTYGDSFTLGVSGGSGDGGVTWAVTSGNSATVVEATGVVTVTGVGQTTITATKSGGTNHKDITDTYTFTPKKKQLTVTGSTASDKIYDKSDASSVTLGTVSGILSGDSVTVTPTGKFASSNAAENITVSISYALSGNNAGFYLPPKADTDKADITPIEIGLEWTAPASLIYDGKAKAPTVEATGLLADESCTVTAGLTAAGSNVDTGSFTFTATNVGNTNYKLPSTVTSPSYTITPAPLTVEVKSGLSITKTYDGDDTVDGDKTGWLEVKGLKNGETATASGTWKYDSSSAGTGKTVNVTGISIGYNTAKASNYSYTASGLTTTGAITNSTMTPTVSGYDKPYDGKPHGISVSMDGADIKYGKTDGTYSQTTSPTYTDVGTYTVCYQVTKANYTTVTGSASVIITPKALTADMIGSITDPTYNGGEQRPAPTVSWTPSGGTTLTLTAGANKDFTFSYDNNTNAATVTSTNAPTVTVTAVANGNYSGSAYKKFTIDPLPATLDWDDTLTFPYDGTDKTVTATVSNKIGNDTPALVYADNIKKDAGSYTAEVTELRNGNYTLTGATGKTQAWSITAIAPTAGSFQYTAPTSANAVYTGSGIGATVTAKANGSLAAPTGTVTVKYSKSTETYDNAVTTLPTEVGEYKVYADMAAKGNYTAANGITAEGWSFTIGAADLTNISVSQTGSLTYNGAAQTATVSAAATAKGGQEANFTYCADEGGTYDSAVPSFTAKGEHTVYYKAAASNHNESSGRFTVTIAALNLSMLADSAITVSPAAADYTGEAWEPAVTVKSGNFTIPATDYEVSYAKNTDAGGAEITVTAKTANCTGAKTVAKPIAPIDLTKDSFTYTPPTGSMVYDSQTREAKVEPKANGKLAAPMGSITVKYAKLSGSSYETPTTEKPSEVGSYKVYIDVAKAGNYNAAENISDDSWVFAITKQPVTALWKNTTKEYTGQSLSPDLVLVGVKDGDKSDVSVNLTEAVNAGTHTVTASLTGGKAGDYSLSNPTGTFVIQKAPVTFTVRGDSVQHDGNVHKASVTATPNAAHTVSYRNSSGKTVANPTEAGSYDIYAVITDANNNYRHAAAADGAARKIGVLTIYRATPPATYTMRFDGGDGSTGNTAALSAAQTGIPRILPDNGFVNAGKAFAGWKYGSAVYQPGESLPQPAGNAVLTAVWIENTYVIDGVVNSDDLPLSDVVVTLMLGSRQIAQDTTDSNGEYDFSEVSPGLYNLVASSKDGITQTILVEIVENNAENQNITMPAQKTNSVVEVAAGLPAIVVGELEKTFSQEDVTAAETGTVEMKLTATALTQTDDQASIESESGGTVGLMMDVTLTKTVTSSSGVQTTKLSDAPIMLQIVIQLPGELQGKDNYTVYRVHNGATQTLTSTPNEDGEHIRVNSDKTSLTVYAKFFSTYAIAYTANTGGAATAYKPVITPTEHGTVTMQPASPVHGAEVTLTLTPEDGYEPASIKVTDKNGKEIAVTKNSDGTYSFTQPDGAVTITARFRAAWNPFADVKAGDWFCDDVRYVYENGLMQGTGDTAFSPRLDTSRGMIVTILWRLENEPKATEAMTFSDVTEGKYYYAAIAWAAENDIIVGFDAATFGPDKPITREQMAAVLYRYAAFKEYDMTAAADLSEFSDSSKISGYALKAMRWANANGFITGKGGSVLDPQGKAERCQVAAILHRFCENAVK